MHSEKIQQIKLIAMDVDGVLTPGDVTYSAFGDEIKSFHIKDGVAIRAAQAVGFHVAVISGRRSAALERRVKELKVENFEPGCRDKSVAIRDLLSRLGLRKEQAAFIGDDLIDIPAFREVGFRIAVGDACEDIKALAEHVTETHGGRGAVREAVEFILRAQGKWAQAVESIVERYQRPVEANAEPDNPAHQ
ncbi:MAG: HAD hydrolase family protein [Armatimonadetes bacterium]|nr:HAD hydrolase family protein [Armatimonadota bacterium]